jgi:23S rRNA pseudouridine2605 synthase
MSTPPNNSPNWAIPEQEQQTALEAPAERLQKFLARSGVASRRHAEALIQAGRVRVNGQAVTQLGTKVQPGQDEVRVDGRVVQLPADQVYLLLHKPAGVVTTASDPEGRQTVLDLLPQELQAQRVFPVGRLDLDSEGLLLLTNDGEFALHLTHPRYEQEKEYHALVQGRPAPAALDTLRRGVLLPGEARPTAPARVKFLREGNAGTSWIAVTLREGRKRQVRRMLAAVGHQVERLIRVRVGPLRLGDLPPGRWRALTADEVSRLRS